MEYLRSIYERRCNTLSEIALHWKEKTRILSDKYEEAFVHLRSENDKLRKNTTERLQNMKLEFDAGVARISEEKESVRLC